MTQRFAPTHLFPDTTSPVRRPAVICKFSDAIVEVVPAYPTDTGYWIADPVDGWMQSHPKDHNKYVNGVNNKHRKAIERLVPQVKIWKYRRNVPLSSCCREMRVAKYIDGEPAYEPLWALYLSLKKMHDAGLAAMSARTGLGSRLVPAHPRQTALMRCPS